MQKSNKITIISLIWIGTIITFCSVDSFIYPTIKINITVQAILLFVCLLCNVIFNKCNTRGNFCFKVDMITNFLLMRVVYYLFLILLNPNSMDYLSNYIAMILDFFVYVWAINQFISEKSILRMSEIIVAIMELQTLIAVITANVGSSMYLLKSLINIPVGASNFITCFLILMFPHIYMLEQNKYIKCFFTISTVITILLSRSTSGFIIFLLLIVLLLLNERKYKTLKMIAFFIAFVCVFIVISRQSSDYLTRLIDNIASIFNNSNIDRALNGRDRVYQESINLILKKPIFGNGFAYRNEITENLMTHNWILEATVTGGLIGLILFVVPVFIYIFKNIHNWKKLSCFQTAVFFAVICVLLQGLVEPSLGSIKFDLLFWLLIGVSNSKKIMR